LVACSSTGAIILGLGQKSLQEATVCVLGTGFVSHNGFIASFSENGIVGTFLLFIFIYYLYTELNKNKKSKYFVNNGSFFIAYIVFLLFQGGNYFYFDIFLALNYSLFKVENIASKLNKVN